MLALYSTTHLPPISSINISLQLSLGPSNENNSADGKDATRIIITILEKETELFKSSWKALHNLGSPHTHHKLRGYILSLHKSSLMLFHNNYRNFFYCLYCIIISALPNRDIDSQCWEELNCCTVNDLSLSIRLLIIINLYYLREHTKCRTFFCHPPLRSAWWWWWW